ncbi:MAG: TraB/GumN family protein [Pseudomonadota bacterium]
MISLLSRNASPAIARGASRVSAPSPALWALAIAAVALNAPAVLADGDDTASRTPLEVVVVTGRQPGPPLWRVSNGDNQLYVFPTFSPVPKGMIWESDRVASVLADSQEVIFAPDVEADFSIGVMLNPINLIRGRRLAKRLTRNPDGKTLDEVLPPALYARYEALRRRYFPRDDGLERDRPFVAGTRLSERIQREVGLVGGGQVTKPLRRLIKRQNHLERTRIEYVLPLKGSFKKLARRADELFESLSQEQELACFEAQLLRMEGDLEAMKSRANAWAQGYVDEFRDIPLPGDEADACLQLLRESSELATIDEVRGELEARWLAAAEQALANNARTFAILDIVELLREDGLLARLQSRGYEVWEP